MYGLSEVQTGEQARHPGRAREPGADAAGDDAVVEEPRSDEREQGRLRPQHAHLVGRGGPRPGARAARRGPRGRATRARSSPRRSRSTAPPTRTASSPSARTSARSCSSRTGRARVGAAMPRDRRQLGSALRAGDRRHRPAAGVPVLRRLPGHLRLHPHQHPHDPRPGRAGGRATSRSAGPTSTTWSGGSCAMMIFGYVGVVDRSPTRPWHEIVAVLFGSGRG